LWTAPEQLYKRHAALNTKKAIQGTQPGDIYSFAIILQEILYRALPYQATGEQTMVTKGTPGSFRLKPGFHLNAIACVACVA